MKALTKAGIVAAMTAALALPTAMSAVAEADERVRPRAVSMCDDFVTDYWDRAECERIGKAGLGTKWWAYVCEEDWFDWNLYVCY